MQNTFNSNDAGKIFVFILLAVPVMFLGVGVVPNLLLIFGAVMLRRTGDFGHIETAARNYRIYCTLTVLVLLGFAGYFYFEYLADLRENPHSFRYSGKEEAVISFGLIVVAIGYWVALNFLFLNPLRANKLWLLKKFSRVRSEDQVGEVGEVGAIDIIKGERLRSFSVADELIKWAKLREDGHITEAEFSEARQKLLARK